MRRTQKHSGWFLSGITWVKPALNLCTFSGNRSDWNGVNNLVLCPGAATASVNAKIWHGGFDCNGINILRDENPLAPASERFKLVGAFGCVSLSRSLRSV